jgi:hypothetical protein
MEYGICNLAIVPLRATAAHRSEMVSQVLFGETFEVLERAGEWVRVITGFDGYEGWINHLQFTNVAPEVVLNQFAALTITTNAVLTPARKEAGNSVLNLPFGSSLPLYDGIKCTVGSDDYDVEHAGNMPGLLETAHSFLNTPYLWGGRTHFGIDCSGYVQAVMRTQGVTLKRDASMQAGQGTVVDFLQEAQLGDLAFFDNAEGRIIHVGMMLDNQNIIHASGKVKIDQIDDQGIYSADQKKYTHQLRIIKRVL